MNWTEHRNPEGRTYWFNTVTRESVWEKPDELKSPFERALNQTKWKEYFSGGRKYYYNTETKESKWDMPDELLLVLEKVEKEGAAAKVPATPTPGAITAPGFTPVTGSASGSATPAATEGQQNDALAVGPHTGGLPLASSSILPARPNLPDDPVIPHNGFATVEEGEKAFTHLLRKAGVDANWTWDQTMRAIITDPLYKALNTLAEKKAVFEKYTTNLKVKEAEEKEARLAKLRPALRNMLKGNPNVFHYSTFATADKLFSQHPIWQQAKIESERKLIFEEYVTELKQREMQESRAARSRSVAKVVNLFKELDVDVLTRWATAYKRLTETEEWENDPDLQALPRLDILLAFEDYSRVREREYDEQMRRSQVEKTRRERKAREAFKDLLQGLVNSGKIKARTKWKEIYPLFKDDERYINMLGNPGSNQLELFWDIVDALDQKLDGKIGVVVDAIERSKSGNDNGDEGDGENTSKGYTLRPETTKEEFLNMIKATADDEVKKLLEEDLHEVFDTLHGTALKKQADEKRRAERKLRHLQDDLRYALRKLPEPLDLNLTYEAAVPLIENLPEYNAIEDEEARRSAFAKFVKRQKERLREAANSEDGGSTTSRKRKEASRDDRDHRDRDRDRDRERDRDRDRDRERSYRDRGKDYDRDSRDSRHHHRYDDYDRSRRGTRSDYPSDRDRDRDRDYRSSKHSRDDRDDRRRDRDREKDKDRKSDYAKDWEDSRRRSDRDKSVSSTYREEAPSRDKRDLEDKPDDRAEKRPRLDSEDKEARSSTGGREDTPEEGEI